MFIEIRSGTALISNNEQLSRKLIMVIKEAYEEKTTFCDVEYLTFCGGENMSFRWLHISDLHFGFDNYTVTQMRNQFLNYIKSLQPIDYLFITGDFIYAPKYNDSDEALLSFIEKIQSILSISKDNIFVVPGNHDIKRDGIRKLVISQVLKSYNSQDGIIEDELLYHLNANRLQYLSLREKITGQNNEANHFFIETNDCNIIHLNTTILSGDNEEEGSLIVGMQLLRQALDKMDTSKSSIVLAHHGFNCLSRMEQYQLESFLKDKNVSLYLCGHNHYATSRIILSSRQDRELWECSCGTQMNGQMVDMSFFAGDFDATENTWIIEAHKWSVKFAGWMLDSDFSFPQGGALDGRCYYPVNRRNDYPKKAPLHQNNSERSDNLIKVFISYSWDSEEHKNKVQLLVEKLRHDGINVIYDGDLKLGDRLFDFMEQSIIDSDFVLFVCSPDYKERADKKTGGVGYENTIISREIYHSHNERKFVPILFSGSWSESVPMWAIGKLGIDFRNQENVDQEYGVLLKSLMISNAINNADIFPEKETDNVLIQNRSLARNISDLDKRFKIAFSFPGEHRNQVKKIIDQLMEHISPNEILYDEFHAAEFARPNLDIYLQKLYHDESELIVVVISKEYETKNWCGLEWRAIRDLINKRQDNIMFLKSGEGSVSGFYDSLDGYIDIEKQGITNTAELIFEKYNFNSQTSSRWRQNSHHLDPYEVHKIANSLAPNLIPCRPGEADLRMKDENGNELFFAYVKKPVVDIGSEKKNNAGQLENVSQEINDDVLTGIANKQYITHKLDNNITKTSCENNTANDKYSNNFRNAQDINRFIRDTIDRYTIDEISLETARTYICSILKSPINKRRIINMSGSLSASFHNILGRKRLKVFLSIIESDPDLNFITKKIAFL